MEYQEKNLIGLRNGDNLSKAITNRLTTLCVDNGAENREPLPQNKRGEYFILEVFNNDIKKMQTGDCLLVGLYNSLQ